MNNFGSPTIQKCNIKDSNIKDIHPLAIEDFFHPKLVESARREWDRMLIPYVADSLQADRVIEEVQQVLKQLW